MYEVRHQMHNGALAESAQWQCECEWERGARASNTVSSAPRKGRRLLFLSISVCLRSNLCKFVKCSLVWKKDSKGRAIRQRRCVSAARAGCYCIAPPTHVIFSAHSRRIEIRDIRRGVASALVCLVWAFRSVRSAPITSTVLVLCQHWQSKAHQRLGADQCTSSAAELESDSFLIALGSNFADPCRPTLAIT